MATEAAAGTARTDDDVIDAVERYKHEHPEVEEALRVFHISDQAYRATAQGLYGRRLSWSNSTNETAKPLS